MHLLPVITPYNISQVWGHHLSKPVKTTDLFDFLWVANVARIVVNANNLKLTCLKITTSHCPTQQ